MLNRKWTVLIVDDEKDFAHFVKANLEEFAHYQVFVETNPHTALGAACRIKPDLILLDIIMPGMNGFELLKKFKENPSTVAIPVLMLTAKGDPESKQYAASLYHDDYIAKPVETEALKSRIEKVLQQIGEGP